MPTPQSKLSPVINNIRNFLSDKFEDYQELYLEYRPGKGWHDIEEPYQSEVFDLINQIYNNLYEQVNVKFSLHDRTTPDDQLLSILENFVRWGEAKKELFQRIADKYKFFSFGAGQAFNMLTDTLYVFQNAIREAKIILGIVERSEPISEAGERRPSDYKIAVITALRDELDAFLNLTNNPTPRRFHDDPNLYFECTIQTRVGNTVSVICAFSDIMGMPAAATLTTKVILKFNPEYIFMCGIAGGVKEKGLSFGDILIADYALDYNQVKIRDTPRFNFRFLNKPNVYNSLIKIPLVKYLYTQVNERRERPECIDLNVRQLISNFKARTVNYCEIIKRSAPGTLTVCEADLKCEMGIIATGGGLIKSYSYFNILKQSYDRLIGIDMETFAVYYSAKNSSINSKPYILSMKSVQDFGDMTKDDTYRGYACYTSAKLLHMIIVSEM